MGNRPIVEKYFSTGSTSHEQLALILNELDRGERVLSPTPSVSVTKPATKQVRAKGFCCTLTPDAIKVAAECFNKCGMFKEEVTPEMTAQFFDNTLPSPFTSNNNHCIALFFDGLQSYGFIGSYWKSVIEKTHCILRNSGKGYLKATDLYSARHAIVDRKPVGHDKEICGYLIRINEIMTEDARI